MDWTHFHLMANHLPVLGLAFGLLILGWGILRRSDDVLNIGLMILVLSAGAAVPVYLTGESAEETVENLPGISEAVIERHEDSALYSLIATIAAGSAALGTLVFSRVKQPVGRRFIFVPMLFSFVALALIVWTANLGGQIRHTEIRSGTQTEASAGESHRGEHGDNDQ